MTTIRPPRVLDRFTTQNLSALAQRSVGFDRIFDDLEYLALPSSNNFPPYNIIRQSETKYMLELAVAGFTAEEIEIEVKENKLTIRGTPAEAVAETSEWPMFIHRGIARRPFERVFTLADHMEGTGATVENGLLVISLEQELPEEKLPKRIAISSKTA